MLNQLHKGPIIHFLVLKKAIPKINCCKLPRRKKNEKEFKTNILKQ